jgi:hypothetical protein
MFLTFRRAPRGYRCNMRKAESKSCSKLLLGLLSLAAAVAMMNAAFAGLKDAPANTVDLTGLWNINPQLSDDPERLLEKKRGRAMQAALAQLAAQEQLDIRQETHSLTFANIEQTNTCKIGEPSQVPTPDGNLADRQCGWKRQQFVVEMKSPHGLTRTDRYELAKGANRLIVTTELAGSRLPMSGVKIRRTYDRVVPR